MSKRKVSIYIYDSETLIIASILFILHFLVHYIIVRNFYIIYQRLQELRHQEVLERFIQTVGEAPLKAYPNYPEPVVYFAIVLAACVSIAGLVPIMYKLIKFLVSRKSEHKQSIMDDRVWFSALALSYLIVYFTIVFMITRPMLVHWADYGVLSINMTLILINFTTKSFVTHARNRILSDPQHVRYVQQFIGRVSNFFFQGFITLFTMALIYILFFGYSSYPEEVKGYSEYIQCIAMGIISGSIYAAIVLRNIYRLLRLEYDIIFRET